MVKQKIIFFLLSLLAFTIMPSRAQQTNLRLTSMGSCDLVFFDRDNDLNLYDFCNNPAALLEDQKEMWMAARTWWNYNWGNFHRQLDPKKQFQFHLQAEGVKPIGTEAAFRGFIRYSTEELQDVYRALEYEPYHDFFTAIDTTTGTFDYYGPILGFEYGRQISSWAAFGGKIVYRLQDGLKREPTRTKVDGRMIQGVIGAHITPCHQFSLGFAFRPFTAQYRINANSSFLLDYPIIYKFFGDSLLVKNEKVDTYDRTTKGQGFGFDGSFVYCLFTGFIIAGKGGYRLENKAIDEGSSAGQRKIDDYGAWQKQGPWIESKCRTTPFNLPLILGLSLGWRSWNSWARTPRFQTLFEEMRGSWTRYGIGLAYESSDFPLKFGIEYHATKFNEEKHNYYQNYNWKRKNNVELFRSGGELTVTSCLVVRFGGALGEEIAEYHLSFDPVRIAQLSFGIGIRLNPVYVEVTGLYEKQRPQSGNVKREKMLILLQLSQRK